MSLATSIFQMDLVIKSYLALSILSNRFKWLVIVLQVLADLNVSFFEMVIAIALSELNLFVYCYYGHLATDCYLKMADLLFESKWYDQHLAQQRIYAFMMQNAQRAYHYHGFGIMTLNLDTYVKVS